MAEPLYDCKSESDTNEGNSNEIVMDNLSSYNNCDVSQDPLDIVINDGSAIETQYPWWTRDSKHVEKLKLQLLNYQLETAKMERERAEKAMQAEQDALELNALERSLRLRAARLEATAAQAKLPANHPALLYTEEEKTAQQYLERYT